MTESERLEKEMKDLEKAMDEALKETKPRAPLYGISNEVKSREPDKEVTKKAVTDPVHSATNADTSRSTRSMEEQMYRIIENLENDIEQARDVRDTVNRRILDLQLSLEATMAAVSVLKK